MKQGGQIRSPCFKRFDKSLLLSPAAFHPHIAASVVIPVSINPMGARMWRLDVHTRHPDILLPVVPVIASVPSPVAMFRRRRRNFFHMAWRWGFVNDNLRHSNARA